MEIFDRSKWGGNERVLHWEHEPLMSEWTLVPFVTKQGLCQDLKAATIIKQMIGTKIPFCRHIFCLTLHPHSTSFNISQLRQNSFKLTLTDQTSTRFTYTHRELIRECRENIFVLNTRIPIVNM